MLVDSNILIFALNDDALQQKAAQLFLSAHVGGLVFAHQNVLETLRIITHNKFPNPYPLEEATASVANITDVNVTVNPTVDTLEMFHSLLLKYPRNGLAIFDMYLVATMLSHKITTLVTDNTKDFRMITEIRVVNPFEKSI